ncbi:hypothetical protein C7271_08775 [filamentous cyanobacterium CCP5]|nr:hypothetical protein C7271_08775 [filamentous cyanobacterium CCP5]
MTRLLPKIVLGAIVVGSLAIAPPVKGLDLDQQLDIPPYNSNQGPARNVADRWLRLAADQAAAEQYESALASWAEAAEIYEALGETESLGRVYDQMGVTLARLGRYDPAEQLLRRRVAIARDNRQPAGEVYGLNNLGTLFLQRGDISVAKAFFSRALETAESIPHTGGIGLSLSNLGLVATLEGNLAEAEKYYESAIAYRLTAGDLPGRANAFNGLARVYHRSGRLTNAIGAYRVALNAGERLGDRRIQLESLDGLRAVHTDRQEWPVVARLLDRRAALTLSSADPTAQTVLTLTYFGDYYEAIGDSAAALGAYRQALNLAQDLEISLQVQQLTNRLINLN